LAKAPFALLLLFPLSTPLTGAAAPLFLEQDRGVFTAAFAGESGQWSDDLDADEASDFSAFSASVGSTAFTANVAAETSASLISSIAAGRIEARGDAAGHAVTGTGDGLARAPADSFFELVFQTDADEPYFLEGHLDVDPTGPVGDAFASVRIVDLESSVAVFSTESAGGPSSDFADTGTLEGGRTYRLTAKALAYSPADTSIEDVQTAAGFELLLLLPEPTGGIGLAASLVLLALLAHRRRRAPSFAPCDCGAVGRR